MVIRKKLAKPIKEIIPLGSIKVFFNFCYILDELQDNEMIDSNIDIDICQSFYVIFPCRLNLRDEIDMTSILLDNREKMMQFFPEQVFYRICDDIYIISDIVWRKDNEADGDLFFQEVYLQYLNYFDKKETQK